MTEPYDGPERRKIEDLADVDLVTAVGVAVKAAADQRSESVKSVRSLRHAFWMVAAGFLALVAIFAVSAYFVVGYVRDQDQRSAHNERVLNRTEVVDAKTVKVVICTAKSEHAIATDINHFIEYGRNVTAAELPLPAECKIVP